MQDLKLKYKHPATIGQWALWALLLIVLAGCASSIEVNPSHDILPVIIGPVDRIAGEPSITNSTCENEWFRSWKMNYFILGKTNLLHTTLTKWVGQPTYSSIALNRKQRVYLNEIQASTAGGGVLFLINSSQSRLSMQYALCNTVEATQ